VAIDAELGLLRKDIPTLIRSDNNGSIAMTKIPKNQQFHKRVKPHRYSLALEQTADVLSKVLLHSKHHKHTKDIGLVSA